MQDSYIAAKSKTSLPLSEDSLLDVLFDIVWDDFNAQCARDHQSNRLLVLADLVFRQDISSKNLERLPAVSSQAFRLLDEDFVYKRDITNSFCGIFSRTFDRNSASYIDDFSKDLSVRIPISLLSYREIMLAYFSLLVKNDSFPIDTQLTKPELLLIRDAFLGERALTNQIASTVERKFQVSLFKQAKLLLHLYKSNDKGWAKQEQKLFYEEFILNFGVRRRYPLPDKSERLIQDKLRHSQTRDDIINAFIEMNSIAGIQMLGYFKSSRFLPRFISAELHTKPKDIPRFSSILPNRRWRPIAFQATDALCIMREHICPESLRIYLLRQLCACFVILRAHGTTGFEDFVNILLGWFQRTFDIDFVWFLPAIYRRSMMMLEPIEDVFAEVYQEKLAPYVEEKLNNFQTNDIIEATNKAVHNMAKIPLKNIAPGNYDFGAFVFDALFDLEYPIDEYPFLIHRIN